MTTYLISVLCGFLPFYVVGGLITFCVYISLGFKQIVSEEEKQQINMQEPLSSNLHPEDVKTKL